MTTLSPSTKSTRQLLEKIGLSSVAAEQKAKLFADASRALASMVWVLSKTAKASTNWAFA